MSFDIERWASEVRRLNTALYKDRGPGRVRIGMDNEGWHADIPGQNEQHGRTAEEAASKLLTSIRRMLARHIEERQKELETLQSLENAASLRLLAADDPPETP